LETSYDFSTSGPGTYTISLTALGDRVAYVVEDGLINYITLDNVRPHVAALSGSMVSSMTNADSRLRSIRVDRGFANVNCSALQTSHISNAKVNAQKYANWAWWNAKSVHNDNDHLYYAWFGNYTQSRRNLVASHFDKIRNGQIKSYIFDCSCERAHTYAYVYPNNLGKVYLCPVFWKAAATGFDSKAGTIVHEASHFTANGGTHDWQYGMKLCRLLARGTPDRAAMNADSHEYFAEAKLLDDDLCSFTGISKICALVTQAVQWIRLVNVLG